jgi:hypothetical protein
MTEHTKSKKSIDKLVADMEGCSIHERRAVLLEVFMEGVLFAREEARKDLLNLRKRCHMKAIDRFDVVTPEAEHEARNQELLGN